MPPNPGKLLSSKSGRPEDWDKASLYDRVNYFLEVIRNTPGYNVRNAHHVSKDDV
jgi:hypothetical protein